ncbi:MAG: YifB family Mg chelatase-like AAA ATPase [Anaerolineae bacterium]|nr:YifB family Mg chelatase-like AAA ATPase [Anaerolineae bacterium]
MLAIVRACAVVGLEGRIIEVQVDFNPRAALPTFSIVGLPDSAVRESRERVRAAIKNSGLQFPNKSYVVNLSPADLPKYGPVYDLAIAVGVLAVTDQIPLNKIENALFLGELSLDGSIRHVQGVMSMVETAQNANMEAVYVPVEDAPQAAWCDRIAVIPTPTLGQLVEHLYNLKPLSPYTLSIEQLEQTVEFPDGWVDFSDIKGQEHTKRALEIAAAGNHNLIMSGPPGAGKSLLAHAIVGILPRLTHAEMLEVSRIYSVADLMPPDQAVKRLRPFRAPHHTTSQAGLVGGGTQPKPGEVTLAHRGVLFLDEINEFGTKVLEVMRQPIEDKVVTISRAKGSLTFPANFLLIGAHNPCPCGYYGDSLHPCDCTPSAIARYQSKLSGPILDRIDLHVDVPRVDYDKLMSSIKAESSEVVRDRVERARAIQTERFKGINGLFANSDMTVSDLELFCPLNDDAKQILMLSAKRMQLSARAYHRVLKLSRTIADLDACAQIQVQHVAEAVQYRPRR